MGDGVEHVLVTIGEPLPQGINLRIDGLAVARAPTKGWLSNTHRPSASVTLECFPKGACLAQVALGLSLGIILKGHPGVSGHFKQTVSVSGDPARSHIFLQFIIFPE